MKNEKQERPPSMVDVYYKRVTRIIEYYIFLCFILITVFPLLEYSWIPGFIRFVYFTGFPLLILLLFVSMIKDTFLGMLKRRFEPSQSSPKSTGRN